MQLMMKLSMDATSKTMHVLNNTSLGHFPNSIKLSLSDERKLHGVYHYLLTEENI